jgi:hypothetical protein
VELLCWDLEGDICASLVRACIWFLLVLMFGGVDCSVCVLLVELVVECYVCVIV